MDGDADDVLTRGARPPDSTLRYGPEPEHVVDLRLPPHHTGAAPLVVVLHGGFWKDVWDRAHAASQSAALAEEGFVVGTVEYRRVGPGGPGWPTTFDDIARAVDTVPSAVRDRLGPAVEVGRCILVGHSAGGHLAVWAASRHLLPAGSPWRTTQPAPVAVVSLAGVLDLVAAHDLQLGDGATAALLGGSPADQPARYAAADPMQLLPGPDRVALVHGAADPLVPSAQSRSYADAVRSEGGDAALTLLPGVGHFELIDPQSAAWPTVLAAVIRLT